MRRRAWPCSVQNKLTDEDTKLAVELNFKHIDDFEPARVAEQIPALKELLDMRHRLTQLLSKMEGNDKLEQLLDRRPDQHRQRQVAGQAAGRRAAAEAPKTDAKPEETK